MRFRRENRIKGVNTIRTFVCPRPSQHHIVPRHIQSFRIPVASIQCHAPKLVHQATHLHNIVHDIFPQFPVYLLSGFLIRTRLCGVCLCTCYRVIIRVQKNMVCKPCVEHEEPDSSSESILVLSSSFLLVRILDGTQTNCVDHKKTTGVWGRGPDPGYVPSEVRWAEGVQA